MPTGIQYRPEEVKIMNQQLHLCGVNTSKKTLPVVVLVVRSWFKEGSSYYTMRVVGLGVENVTHFSYGHGYAEYIQRASDILGVATYGEVDFVVDETYVSRRKDLHYGGRGYIGAKS
jgi:hypothetical protein